MAIGASKRHSELQRRNAEQQLGATDVAIAATTIVVTIAVVAASGRSAGLPDARGAIASVASSG